MSKQEDWWPSSRAALLVVLGLATGTAVVQRSPGAPPRPSPSAAAAETSEAAHASGLSAAEHVIELLADSVGADLENLEARDAAVAWRDYLCLKSPRIPDDTQARMLSALDAVAIRLGGRAHADVHPADAPLHAIQLTDALSVIRAHVAFEGGDPEIKKRRAVVTEYFETSGPKNSIDTIARKAGARQMKVRMLIAMLPDYIDSQTRRLFDSGLAGIQQAAGTLGYTLDRFHLPGWSAHDHPGARPPSAHDSEPGALLFRSSRSAENELLVVLIVTEMPTLGVHRNAMASSIALIDAWAEASSGSLDTLRILGPFFSGSVPSLKDIFESLENESAGEPRTVQIVTGTATDPSIEQQLRSVSAQGVHVSFQAIVPNNDQVRTALLDRLKELNPKWRCGNAIALLVEGNTKFGQSLLIRKSDSTHKDADASRSNSADDCLPPLEVTFPLHISRLRATVDAEAPTVSLLTPPAVKLKLTESTQPMDVVPSMTPDLTASVVDSAVDNLLAALHRERYSAIGIFATDARDHLFLARRIAKAVPDVLMFGTQADLLYVNREYAPFLRGTLIASSYPVFSQTQLLADATNDALRRQFTTASEQGAYNATLTLLADRHTDAVTLIDGTFGPPCAEKACAPRVWLSVVGSNAMWPIDSSVNLDDQLPGEKPVTLTNDEENAQKRLPRPITAAPPSIVAAAMTVFAVALVHLLGLMFTLTAPKHAARPNPHRTHHVRNKQDIAEAAKDLAAMCHWQNSRVLWNFYPPSDVVRPPAPPHAEKKETEAR